MSLEVGQLIEGKYRIIELIGEGGMGAVYLGENVRIQRKVAIKVLHGAYSSNVEVAQRFEREAQAAGRIGNDHILEVLDLGELPDGERFMVMEHLDGETLAHRIKRLGRMSPQQVAPLARQMVAGLAAAHAAGIVHRDLKPENIFILKEKAGKKDYVKIIDFGISKFQPLGGDAMKMTRTGVVMGTPYYMAPEQASGSRDADARSDLYAIGVMLYEAITGRVPFDAPTFNQLMFQIVLSEPPPPQTVVPDLDPAFASIVSKGMARDVNHRFQSAAEFGAAIDAWLDSGTAVAVPPAAAADPTVLGAGRHRTALIMDNSGAVAAAAPGFNMTPGRGTAGNWATSQAGVIPKKSAAPIIVAAVLGGLLLIGGVAVAAVALLRGGDQASASAASAVPPAAPPPTDSAAEPKAELLPPEATQAPIIEPADDPPGKSPEKSPEPEPDKVTEKASPRPATGKITARPSSGSSKSGSQSTPSKSGAKSATKPPAPTDFGY